MVNMRTLYLYALLVVIGCGGGPPESAMPVSYRASGPADIAAMRALVERYSPTGSWIVRANEKLPHRFVIAGREVTLTNDVEFGKFYEDGAPEKLVSYTDTAVHEGYHGISSRLGLQLLADSNATELVDNEGVWVGGTPLLVVYSAHYPAREMDATFPADARTSRYATYVFPSVDSYSTQRHGVFGLLDEWTAYLHGSRAVVDFWPWIRDESPRSRDVYVHYRWDFHRLVMPYAEFKLFILHYLVHARDHRPDVYRGLIANESFKRAFIAVDDAWTDLIAAAKALEPDVAAIAAERGAANATYELDEAYPAALLRLASPAYQQVLADLRGP